MWFKEKLTSMCLRCIHLISMKSYNKQTKQNPRIISACVMMMMMTMVVMTKALRHPDSSALDLD